MVGRERLSVCLVCLGVCQDDKEREKQSKQREEDR